MHLAILPHEAVPARRFGDRRIAWARPESTAEPYPEPVTRWTLDDLPDQTGRRWLVTGATHGLGRATAAAAARAGASLILPVRNEELGRQLVASLPRDAGCDPVHHDLVPLDLGVLDSVRAAAAEVTALGEIDVLVNNAGVMTRRREETADGFERMLGVNFLGPFAFTNLVLPRVVGRVIVVGSNAHKAASFDFHDPHARRGRWRVDIGYARSKLADMLWGLALDRRLAPSGRPVHLVHPGWVMRNMQSAIGNPALERAITLATTPIAQSAEKSALCTLFAATMDLPACSYVGPDGRTALHGYPCLLGRSAEASDPRLAERVWALGVQETHTDLED